MTMACVSGKSHGKNIISLHTKRANELAFPSLAIGVTGLAMLGQGGTDLLRLLKGQDCVYICEEQHRGCPADLLLTSLCEKTAFGSERSTMLVI